MVEEEVVIEKSIEWKGRKARSGNGAEEKGKKGTPK